MKTYAVLGTGAIGGYCAVKLAQAGFDVHCLLRSDYHHVKQHGLALVSDSERISVSVNSYQDIQSMPLCDVILVALKSTGNSQLKEMLPRIMHASSVVVILQNGIGAEQEVARYIEPAQIVGGVCMLKVSKESPGVIRHFGLNSIELAQYYVDSKQVGITTIVEEIAKSFIKSGIQSAAVDHLPTVRWKKLVANMALSGLSVVLGGYTQELINNPASFSALCDITKEVITAAEKLGVKLPSNFFEYRLSIFKELQAMKNNYSSMKEDFDAKRPLELHGIYENAILLAKKENIAMPLTELLYQQLLFLDERNQVRK